MMSNIGKRLLIGVLLLLMAGDGSLAVEFSPPIREAAWIVEGSIYNCQISQKIPYYGTAVFSRRAGEPQRFFLHPKTSHFKPGKALVVAESPAWKPKGKDIELGYVSVKQGVMPVSAKSRVSTQMLDLLYQGQQIVFTRYAWFGGQQSSRVTLLPINFYSAYRHYLDCVTKLLPVNFDQVARSTIYFQPGSARLTSGELKKLKNISVYVNADSSVTGCFVDGHTDSIGMRSKNLDLSKQRAEIVTRVLIENGLQSEKITTRWHGERYPVASNRSLSNRAQNRRVTIRLDRSGIPLKSDLAQTQ